MGRDLESVSPISRSTDRRSPDRVDLSPAAQARSLDDAKEPLRAELIVRVRQELVAGQYDTQARLESAIDALIRDLGVELASDNDNQTPAHPVAPAARANQPSKTYQQQPADNSPDYKVVRPPFPTAKGHPVRPTRIQLWFRGLKTCLCLQPTHRWAIDRELAKSPQTRIAADFAVIGNALWDVTERMERRQNVRRNDD